MQLNYRFMTRKFCNIDLNVRPNYDEIFQISLLCSSTNNQYQLS